MIEVGVDARHGRIDPIIVHDSLDQQEALGVKRPALGMIISAFELEGRRGPLRRVGIGGGGEPGGSAVR